MNIIIPKNNINNDKIIIKNNNKILYNFNGIQLLGISFTINKYKYQIVNNYIKLELLDENDINLIKQFDLYFKSIINNYKGALNENNIIFVKNILHKQNLDDTIYLNINSLKNKDLILYLNILTL
jgi:hypothetical protein